MRPATRCLIAGVATIAAALPAAAQEVDMPPPPHYFVSAPFEGGPQFFGGPDSYSGAGVLEGYNLLAYLLGDTPSPGPRQMIVGSVPFAFHGGSVTLQPFVYRTSGSTVMRSLPAGPALDAFLDDPLGGPAFDLTMPFRATNVALSDSSAMLRRATSAKAWHTAIDFDLNGATDQPFDVVAAADGVVERNTPGNTDVVIRHQPAGGRPFLTIYQHLLPSSKTTLAPGSPIRRGDPIGRLEVVTSTDGRRYAHLHFAVAVRVEGRRGLGGVDVPASWFLLDPFGVYDYRRNRSSATAYNYLPSNTLERPVQGIVHAYAFRTNPPIGSVLLPEDCVGFNPGNLTVGYDGVTYTVRDGSHALFAAPSAAEAGRIVQVLTHYQANRSCFIGRPDPSFSYLLRNADGPAGSLAAEDCLAFAPASLSLEPASGGGYRMMAGSTSLFSFPNMLEAGNALSAIRKYGFTRSCYVGRPGPSLVYLRR